MDWWKGKLSCSSPKRPKTIGLAQNSGPPCWPEANDPAGVILYVMDGQYRQPFPYRTGCPDYWQEVPSCELMEFPAAVI
jgi:hypothetical protein